MNRRISLNSSGACLCQKKKQKSQKKNRDHIHVCKQASVKAEVIFHKFAELNNITEKESFDQKEENLHQNNVDFSCN